MVMKKSSINTTSNYLGAVLVFLTMFSFLWHVNGYVESEPLMITNNDFNDNFGNMDEGLLAWQGGEGDLATTKEIFLYDITKEMTIQITDNDYDDRLPQVNNRRVTWIGIPPDGSDYEVFLYDYETGITRRITDNNLIENHPRMNDGYITWYAWESPYIGAAEIYLYNIATDQTIKITNNQYSDYYPYIKEGKVIWWGHRGKSTEILFYDISTGETTQLTDNNIPEDSAQLDNGLMVWRALIDGEVKLFLHDFTSGQTLPIADPLYSYSYSLYEGKVVYVKPDGTGKEFFLYNYFDGTTTQVTNNDYIDLSGSFQDGTLVFVASGNIFFYDINSGVITQMTDSSMYNTVPRYQNGILAWMGRHGPAGLDYEIFLRYLSISAGIDIDPDTLNLKSNGNWITAYIELPDGYNVLDIDIESIVLTIDTDKFYVVLDAPFQVDDYDNDGISDLMVKFDRTAIVNFLDIADEVTETGNGEIMEFTITGTIAGTTFRGSDWIKVILPGG